VRLVTGGLEPGCYDAHYVDCFVAIEVIEPGSEESRLVPEEYRNADGPPKSRNSARQGLALQTTRRTNR
jgi:hypothetical protein